LTDETYQKNADQLKHNFLSGQIKLFAPSFLMLETANALWVALKFLQYTQIRLYEFDWSNISQNLAIACKVDIAVYDAAYLYLCNKLEAELITADNKLFENAKDYYKVKHIKDYITTSES